jgi:hypothetical protein
MLSEYSDIQKSYVWSEKYQNKKLNFYYLQLHG